MLYDPRGATEYVFWAQAGWRMRMKSADAFHQFSIGLVGITPAKYMEGRKPRGYMIELHVENARVCTICGVRPYV